VVGKKEGKGRVGGCKTPPQLLAKKCKMKKSVCNRLPLSRVIKNRSSLGDDNQQSAVNKFWPAVKSRTGSFSNFLKKHANPIKRKTGRKRRGRTNLKKGVSATKNCRRDGRGGGLEHATYREVEDIGGRKSRNRKKQ